MAGESAALGSDFQESLDAVSALTTFYGFTAFSSGTFQAVVALFGIVAVLLLKQCRYSGPLRNQSVASSMDFHQSLDVAFQSALTKFDSLSTYFARGMNVPAVAAMLLEEICLDQDFAHFLQDDDSMKKADRFVKQNVGPMHAAWKKGQMRDKEPNQATTDLQGTLLPWPSIEPYPDWVCEEINKYLQADQKDKAFCRAELEKTLLTTPLWSASIKYDGTCFGKMDTGKYAGRRHVVGNCSTYQQTSTSVANSCDVKALKDQLSRMLHIPLESGSVCVWGELMCNPGYYDYRSRGLANAWLPFGVVLQVTNVDTESLMKRLQKEDLAFSQGEDGKFRLLMCPSLRGLLQDVAKCRVVETFEGRVTHAQLVAQGAKELMEGRNEGVVLAFRRHQGDGRASLRKWKNSAEGDGNSKRHAQRLRQLNVRELVNEGKLNPEIAKMVEKLIEVAESETKVSKIGRKKELSRTQIGRAHV